MAKYALVIDGLIDNVGYEPFEGYVEVPDEAFGGDAFYGDPPVFIPKPTQFHYWTGTTFVLNQAAFTAYLVSQIGFYRDAKTQVNVSYDNGTDEFTVLNDDRTRQALLQKANRLQLEPDETINFQTVNGYFDLSIMDIQGLFRACDMRQQDCFDASKYVFDTHAVTPYETIQDAKDDFDSQL